MPIINGSTIHKLALPERHPIVDYWDAGQRGFGVRVFATGRRSYICRCTFNGKLQLHTIGEVGGEYTLPNARKKAREIRAKAKANIDPRGESNARKAEIIARGEVSTTTVEAVWRGWCDGTKANPKSDATMRQRAYVWKFYTSAWAKHEIASITIEDCNAVLRAAAERGNTDSTPYKVQIVLRAFFNHAMKQRHITWSPASASITFDQVKRKRVLTPDEIKVIWTFAERVDPKFGEVIHLLILTALRKEECLGLRWDEFNASENLFLIPGQRMKVPDDHYVPLSPRAREIVDRIDGTGRVGPFVLGTQRNSYSSFSRKIKNLRALIEAESPMPHWQPHDFRRTFTTIATKAKQNYMGIEYVLAHRVKTATQESYNHHDYVPERREVLDWWEAYVLSIVS
jgi:integrase